MGGSASERGNLTSEAGHNLVHIAQQVRQDGHPERRMILAEPFELARREDEALHRRIRPRVRRPLLCWHKDALNIFLHFQ